MIQLHNITKKYGDTLIFDNMNYSFPETGMVCLMGASGGGKTTLLNLLAGFDTDYEGEILVGSTPINEMDKDSLCRYRRDNIGFVFQNYHLLTGYTVLENVCLASFLREISPEKNKEKAIQLLEQLGIGEKQNQKAENLSGGQKQRVAIARALINDPQILFADEPTGALDRTTSTQIMKILQEIAKDRLVILITHDPKVCEFANEVIHIKEYKIVSQESSPYQELKGKPLIVGAQSKGNLFALGAKNFKVHISRYIAASLAISIGLLAFLFSLSFGNVMDQSITQFKEKNTAFNNGYIKGEDDGTILDYLKDDPRIENVYYQYKLGDISLTLDGKSQHMDEKFPMPKATESLSYGVMPKIGRNEIAITPSLAKKFGENIKAFLGKTLKLELNGQIYELTVSGIYNAGYDDFFVSSDVELLLYQHITDEKNYSISYDVKDFSNIVGVSNSLELGGLDTKTAVKEVSALQNTFRSLNQLFVVISILILAIGLFICTVILIKLQNTRSREIGLLSALGFSRQQISSMIGFENLLLCTLAMGVNLILLGLSMAIGKLFLFTLIFNGTQVILSVGATFIVILLLCVITSYKLVRTEPAVALRA